MSNEAGQIPEEYLTSRFTDGQSVAGRVTDLCNAFEGRVGVAVLNLQSGEEMLFHADEVFPTASVIKLAILIAFMEQCDRGVVSLDEPLMLRRGDMVGGSGILQHLSPGLTMSARDWAFLMMNVSDNLATNVLIDYVGLEQIQDWLARSEFSDVKLHRKIDFGALAVDQKNLGTATPRALNQMMTAVFKRNLVTPAFCDKMMVMMDKVGADRAGRYLPFNPYGDEDAEEVKLHLAGKTGSLAGTRCQTAAIWRGKHENPPGFIITVMSEGNIEPELWSVDAPGVLLIGKITRLVYDAILGDGFPEERTADLE